MSYVCQEQFLTFTSDPSDRMADDRFEPLRRGAAGVSQVYLVVPPDVGEVGGAALLLDERCQLIDTGGLGVIGADVEEVGAQPLLPAEEPGFLKGQAGLLFRQTLQRPGEDLLIYEVRLADEACPAEIAFVRRGLPSKPGSSVHHRPSRGGTT